MATLRTPKFGRLDVNSWQYYWPIPGNSGAGVGYTVSTNLGNMVFVPEDFILKGYLDGTKQRSSGVWLNRDNLKKLYTEGQAIDISGLGTGIEDHLARYGMGTKGVLIPEKKYLDYKFNSKYTNYDINDPAEGGRVGGEILGMGEYNGRLVYVRRNTADVQAAYNTEDGVRYGHYTKYKGGWLGQQIRGAAKTFAGIPFAPEIIFLATGNPVLYASLKGIQTLGLGGGVNDVLTSYGTAWVTASISQSPYVQNIGANLAPEASAAIQSVIGSSVTNAAVSGILASLKGADVGKSMLAGAATGAISASAADLTSALLGGTANVEAIGKQFNLTPEEVAVVFAGAFADGIVATLYDRDFGQEFLDSLISRGVGQNIATEVNRKLIDSVGADTLNDITNASKRVGTVATNAALKNEDVGKAVGNAIPSIIIETVNARKIREEQAAAEAKRIEEEKATAKKLAEDLAAEKVTIAEVERQNVFDEIRDEFAKFAEQEAVDVAALPAAAASAAGTALARAAIQSAPGIARIVARFAANDPRFAQEIVNNQFVKDILLRSGLEAVIVNNNLEIRPIITGNESNAETARLLRYASDINKSFTNSNKDLITRYENEAKVAEDAAIAKNEPLIEFPPPIQTKFEKPEDMPDYTATSVDLEKQINDIVAVGSDAEKRLVDVSVQRTILNEQLAAANLSISELETSLKYANSMLEKATTTKAKTEVQTLIDKINSDMVTVKNVIARIEDKTAVNDNQKTTIEAEIKNTVDKLNDLRDKFATESKVFDEMVNAARERQGSILNLSEFKFAEPSYIKPDYENYIYGTQYKFSEQEKNLRDQAATAAFEIANLEKIKQQTVEIYNQFDPLIKERLKSDYETQIKTIDDDIARLRDIESTATSKAEQTAAETTDFEKFLKDIEAGREQRTTSALDERYRREMELFDRELQRLEDELQKAETEQAQSKARESFVTSQRERLSRADRLPGRLQEQINRDLERILSEYDVAKTAATAAATRKEEVAAVQQSATARKERREIKDEDIIRLLNLPEPEAKRYGFLTPGEQMPEGEVQLTELPPEPTEKTPTEETPTEGETTGKIPMVKLQPMVISEPRTRTVGETTQTLSPRVTGEALASILGEKEPLFGGDEDQQRAVWNRRSLRLRRALGL